MRILGPILNWETLALAVSVGIGGAIALLLLRRLLGWMLGPIFVWETVRLARKGHTFWLRGIFALLFLAMLYTSKPDVESFTPDQEFLVPTTWPLNPYQSGISFAQPTATELFNHFAEEFSNAFLLTLAIGMLLITPMYFATTISEEKERRSIDFLLTTHVSSREIILGKLDARLLNLLGMLLAGLPVLALTQLWGGVDWLQILTGFATIVVAVICYGCISMFCSVAFARTRNAVLAAYGLVLLFSLITGLIGESSLASPIMRIIQPRNASPFVSYSQEDVRATVWSELFGSHGPPWVQQLTLLVLNLVIALIFLLAAILAFRFFARRHASVRRRVFAKRTAKTSAPIRVPHPLTVAVNPPVGSDPLVWKEHYLGRTWGGSFLNSTVWVYVYLLQGVLAVIVGLIVAWGVQNVMVRDLGVPFRAVTVLLCLLVLLSVGLRMASVVSREREQQTLVSLLTTPISSYRILRAKWLGTLLRSRRALAGLAAWYVMAGVVIQFDPYEWLLLPLTFLAHVWFVGNLALWLSVECRSTNRVYSIVLGVLLFIVGGAWITSYFQSQDASSPAGYYSYLRTSFRHHDAFDLFDDHERANVIDWLSPPQTWWRLMLRNVEEEEYLDNARQYMNSSDDQRWNVERARILGERKGVDGHIIGWLIYFGAGSFFAIMSLLRFGLLRPHIRPFRYRFLSQAHPALRR